MEDTSEDGTGMEIKMMTLILNQVEHPNQALNQQVLVGHPNQAAPNQVNPNQAAPNHQDHLDPSQVVVVDLALLNHNHLLADLVAAMVAREVVRRPVTITDITTTINTTSEKLHQWNHSPVAMAKSDNVYITCTFKCQEIIVP